MGIYLVTGAAGFIGSSLCRALIQRGDEVRGMDNFFSGKPENIAAIRSQMDFREADLLDMAAVRDACAGVEFIFHEAAIPSVPRSVADPQRSHEANLTGTLNLLVAARDAKVKRVIYASSSSVYGETPTLPKKEEMAPAPISPYAVQKAGAELYMKSFHQVYGLETTALRYFNIFGPWQDPASQYSGVVAKFCLRMLRGEQPEIYGDGEQSRDFTFIDNAVRANLLAAAAPALKAAGRTFNIACGRRVTLNEVARCLRELTGYTGDIIHRAERPGDIRDSLADISLARTALGYEPTTTYERGLELTVAWYRQMA